MFSFRLFRRPRRRGVVPSVKSQQKKSRKHGNGNNYVNNVIGSNGSVLKTFTDVRTPSAHIRRS
jgi:hypothetical protein